MKKSIIWNVTRNCSWRCSFCCVDAKFIACGKRVSDSTNQLDEMTFEEKISVIDKLAKEDVRVSFSGGEVFIDPKNIDLIIYASKKLGKENVGINSSGAFLTKSDVENLSHYIHDIEFTLDFVPFKFYSQRPPGYHEFASNAIREFAKYEVVVGAQTVVTTENIENLEEIYDWCVDNGVTEWTLLRYFPSGRGKTQLDLTPTIEQYKEMVEFVKSLNAKDKITVNFQYLLPNHEKFTLDCRAVKKINRYFA